MPPQDDDLSFRRVVLALLLHHDDSALTFVVLIPMGITMDGPSADVWFLYALETCAGNWPDADHPPVPEYRGPGRGWGHRGPVLSDHRASCRMLA
jgi:hypothetical protein